MLSGAVGVSRGWPAIGVLNLVGDQKAIAKSPMAVAGDEVVLSAIEHPPRVGEMRPIAALMPEVLARYGLNTATAPITDALQPGHLRSIEPNRSIDVSA